MRWLYWWLTVAVGVLLFSPLQARASTQDFTIDSFTANYDLSQKADKSATMQVKERIVAEFPDYDQNHGILRAIPERYQGHTLSLKINSVTNGQKQPWPYTTSHDSDNLVLKIGDAKRYVHNQQIFVINYTVRNPIAYFGDHQELYWDINGDQWPQPFGRVTAIIHIEPPASEGFDGRQKCFVGSYGGHQTSNCQMAEPANSDRDLVTSFTASDLSAYETLTFVLGFKNSTFVQGPEIAHEQQAHRWKVAIITALIGLPPAVAFWLMFRRWRQFGNDPRGRGIIIPEYEPPAGFNVLASQYLRSYSVDQRAFSAAIIQLAVMGYLTIYETKQKKRLARDKPDYELELNRDPADLPAEMSKVVEILFDMPEVGGRIKLSEFRKSHTNIYSDINDLRQALAVKLTSGGYFQKDPTKVRSSYLAWGFVMLAVSFGLLFVWPITVVAAGVFLSALVVLIFAFIMPARTAAGVQVHDDLLGLRDYIKLAEADRLKYLQSAEGAEKIDEPSKFNPKSPAAKVKLFEKLLPYAMLFGLEKSWAKQFADIYKSPPDWYRGNVGSFNAVYLGSQLSSFASASSVSFSSPSSSSGSGFSSGGGFSGGGGGGGGGGGW